MSMLLNLVTGVTIITHSHDQQELQDEQICLSFFNFSVQLCFD